jgi:hypothetical protein
MRFKTDHLAKMNFNTKKIRREFQKVRKENEAIIKESIPDLSKLNEIYF